MKMKVLVIGLSPYLVTSRSKVFALIMRYLYYKGVQVAGAVWGHDVNCFPPEKFGSPDGPTGPTGPELHFYKFEILDSNSN